MGLYRVLYDFQIENMHPDSGGTADYGVTAHLQNLIIDNVVGKELNMQLNSNYEELPYPVVTNVKWLTYVCKPDHGTPSYVSQQAIHPVLRASNG